MNSRPIDTADRPLVATWELTRACGLACDDCWTNATESRHPNELSTAEAKRLLDRLREFGANLLVVLSGGDPFERDDLLELVEYGTDVGLTITLNATGAGRVPQPRLERLVEAGLYRLVMSLDGANAATHDGVRGAPGSFEATVETIEAARRIDLPTGVNTLVSAETFGDLPEIRDALEGFGVVLWNLFFLVPVEERGFLESVDPSTADAIMRWLHEASKASPFDVRTIEAPQYRRVAIKRGEVVTGVRDQFGTYAGDGIVHVDHLGDVYPSEFLRVPAGNVRESSIVETYRNSSLFEELRDRGNLEGRCGACPYREICGGSRARGYAATGNVHATDPLCPFLPPGFEE